MLMAAPLLPLDRCGGLEPVSRALIAHRVATAAAAQATHAAASSARNETVGVALAAVSWAARLSKN